MKKIIVILSLFVSFGFSAYSYVCKTSDYSFLGNGVSKLISTRNNYSPYYNNTYSNWANATGCTKKDNYIHYRSDPYSGFKIYEVTVLLYSYSTSTRDYYNSKTYYYYVCDNPDYLYNFDTFTCEIPPPTCSQNEELDPDTNTCVCKQGYKPLYDSGGNKEGCEVDCSSALNVPNLSVPYDWKIFINQHESAIDCKNSANGEPYDFSTLSNNGCDFKICSYRVKQKNCLNPAPFEVKAGYKFYGEVDNSIICENLVDGVNFLNYYVEQVYPTCPDNDKLYCFLKPNLDNNSSSPPPSCNNCENIFLGGTWVAEGTGCKNVETGEILGCPQPQPPIEFVCPDCSKVELSGTWVAEGALCKNVETGALVSCPVPATSTPVDVAPLDPGNLPNQTNAPDSLNKTNSLLGQLSDDLKNQSSKSDDKKNTDRIVDAIKGIKTNVNVNVGMEPVTSELQKVNENFTQLIGDSTNDVSNDMLASANVIANKFEDINASLMPTIDTNVTLNVDYETLTRLVTDNYADFDDRVKNELQNIFSSVDYGIADIFNIQDYEFVDYRISVDLPMTNKKLEGNLIDANFLNSLDFSLGRYAIMLFTLFISFKYVVDRLFK